MKKFQYFLIIGLFVLFLSACTSSYTVSFITNTDEDVEDKVLTEGEDLELPPLTKEGYDLSWYYDENFTTEYTGQKITEDTTLYAKWDIKKYTVRFMNGNLEVSKVTVEHGKNATAPTTNPTKLGYEFKGWDKLFTNVKENLVVNALFDVLKFEVKFMNGDTELSKETIEFGKAATAPTDPIKEGYTFKGWDKEFSNVTENLVVNALFEINKYTVTFVDKDGTQLDSMEVEHGSDATAPTAPTKEGYTFKGWDKEFTNVTNNLSVKATYELINYSIKYFLGDEELELMPDSYNFENSVVLPPYLKQGYIFIGWFYNADFSDELVTSIGLGYTGDKVLYAKLLDESDLLTIEYELNGGTWDWTAGTVSAPASGINAQSNLPEIFMVDFYTYLKDNNLLSSAKVKDTLRKTTWADFSNNYTDPVAIYNWTSTNTGTTTDGYSQFFFDSATGNADTGEIFTVTGGFFGSEKYGKKYFGLLQHISLLMFEREDYKTSKLIWSGASSKSLAGFTLDGYFYGTQGLTGRTDKFKALRAAIPQPNKAYKFVNNVLTAYDLEYPTTSYINGLKGVLSTPSKEGYVFAGWFDNAEFTGNAIFSIPVNETPAAKYYAKWVAVGEY